MRFLSPNIRCCLLFLLLVMGMLMLGSCKSPVQREVDEAVSRVERAGERMMDRSDRTVGAALNGLDRSVRAAQAALQESVKQARVEYQVALADTSTEVNKLREELKADVNGLEAKLEERIEQMRSSALDVVAETDKATQARIDQVFTELRLFMKETLAEIRTLIIPVLELAQTLQGAVENGNEQIAKISEKIIELVEQIRDVFKEVDEVLHQVQGENAQGEKVDVPTTEIFAGLLAGVLALITAITTRFQRSSERKRQGERWKEEELEKLVTARVAVLLKEGILDDEVMGVLNRRNLVKTEAHGEFDTEIHEDPIT